MKTKQLTNDECIPHIRTMTGFSNRTGSLTGEQHTPGVGTVGMGNLPVKYHPLVREATFVVFSYDTPIAWYGPEASTDAATIHAWLAHPTAADLDAYVNREVDNLRTPEFPGTEPLWQMPNVKYSRTTTQHQWVLWSALAYEKTWREAEDHISIPAPHYKNTDYGSNRTPLERVPSSTGGVNW